jgi:phage tail-like protein
MATVFPSQGVLLVEFGGDIVRTLPLAFATLRIGRAPDNDLSLQHPGISRHHLELTATESGIVVTDLGSANGTFVDGARILPYQPVRVEPGRAVRIGPFFLAMRRSPGDVLGWVEPPAANGEARRTQKHLDPTSYSQALARRAAARRPALPARDPDRTLSRYLDYLPSIFGENGESFLGRFLLIFESIWEPLEQRQDHLEMYVDPATCPAGFLSWLASWFDLSVGAHWPESRVRELLSQAMELYQWRGTRYGMQQMIELWTGLSPHIEESPTEPFLFHVQLRVPSGGDVDRRLVEELLRAHKPAYAGFLLEIVTDG